jgi:TonB-dependent receptor
MRSKFRTALLRSGVSLLAVAGVAITTPGYAQDAPAGQDASADAGDEVVVVGVRKSLKTAQQIKRDADTVVDSITATDIGAFPDKSVAEALQRVAGVTVARFAAKNDVMRFSAEPSGVTVRGLQQVRSEFNGRDSFSANSSYGLSWSDVSPELMAGVDTYKNQTADLIEGGIAGSINLRTRLPFDSKGRLIAFSADYSYGNLSEEWTPAVSGLYSNRWDSALGEFGLLANFAYSEVATKTRGTNLPRMMPFTPSTYDTADYVYIPSGFNINENNYVRTREGLSLAAQWRSNDERMTANLQYNRSSYDNTWTEDAIAGSFTWVNPGATTMSTEWDDPQMFLPPDADNDCFNCAGGGTPFTFASNGLFQTGVITNGNSWGYGDLDWGSGTAESNWQPTRYQPGSTDQFGTHDQHGVDLPYWEPCINSGSSHGNRYCRYGNSITSGSRYSTEVRTIEDLSGQFIWQVSDRLRLNFDAQYVTARTDNYDVSQGLQSHADIGLDLTGKYPRYELLAPSRINHVGTDPFADIRNYSPGWIMDHVTESEGKSLALRLDGLFEFDGTWLDQLKAGVRTSDREQKHRYSAYNWASVGGMWQTNAADSYFADSGPTYNSDGSIRFQGYEPGYWENRSLSADTLGTTLINQLVFPHVKNEVMSDPEALAKIFSVRGQTDEGGTASSTWNPICERPAEMTGSCFLPGEILDVNERTKSAYVMLKFGGRDASLWGFGVSGNVGVRYVETTVESAGGITFPVAFTSGEVTCVPLTPQQIAELEPGQYAVSPGCLAANSLDDQAFSNNAAQLSTVETTHTNWLPSFNLKVDLNEKWIVRFAASRAMSRPDMAYYRNYMTLSRGALQQSDIRVGNPDLVLNGSGVPVSYRYSYSGQTGNPRVKPVTADQFDLTVENYFAQVGSFTANLFYKKFYDYIQNGTFIVPLTNNGVTRDVRVQGPVNGEGAAIKGFELSYQRFFDFLPAPFDGFGVQANYTHIVNDGVTNQNLVLDSDGGNTTAGSAEAGTIDPGRLEGLSDDSYNLVLMYEKGKLATRLAYNWRSEYLISVNDCCIGLPVWNDAEGFLDGSIRYRLNDNVEISLQGSNLLGQKTIYRQQIAPRATDPSAERLLLPAGFYESDRRIQFGVRLKY